MFKATDGLQFLVVYDNVSADVIGAICHQLGLLCTDLHAICCGGLFTALALVQLGHQCRQQNIVCNCPASDTDCSYMVFK